MTSKLMMLVVVVLLVCISCVVWADGIQVTGSGTTRDINLGNLRDVIIAGGTLGAIEEQVTKIEPISQGCLVWRILYDLPEGLSIRLRIKHAAAGKDGAFYFTAWSDKDNNGVPDTNIATSQLMTAWSKDQWSDWEFLSTGKPIFVGIAMKTKASLYYQMGGDLEGYYGLSDRVFYSRAFDQPPENSAQPRYINIRLEILPLSKIHAKTIVHRNKVPIIYCTDLFHPFDDPDDHFDIACLYAIPEMEIKGIILDQGAKQKKKSGSIPILQLNHITERNVPHAIGLANKLKSPKDKCLWQAKEYQKGVELILAILKNSKEPVSIISVGSLRDVAASYNRSPSLFKNKVNKLFVFIGEASKKGHIEYNMGLDKNAYIQIMNSGLPIYWVPCFDGGRWQNNGSASYWKASHKDLLRKASSRVMNFFIYALLKKKESDPIPFLNRETNREEVKKVLLKNRNLWCSSIFPYIAGRRYVRHENEYISIPISESYDRNLEVRPFAFEEVSVFVDEQATVIYEGTNKNNKIKRFRLIDKDTYPEVMTSITANLLLELDR